MAFILRCRALPPACRVLLGLGAAALAAVLRVVVLAGLGTGNPYLTFVPTVAVVAMLAGLSAGLSALLLSVLSVLIFVTWPTVPSEFIMLAVFMTTSVITCVFAEMLHRLYAIVGHGRAADEAREQKLLTFVAQAPVAIAMFDRDMRYLSVSQLWLDLFSDGTTNFIGRSHYELFPALPAHWIDAHRRGLAGETVREQLDRVNTPHFGDRWYRWEVRPWILTEGGIGGITIFAENVTDRVEREAALRKSETRFRAFFENIGVGAALIGADGRFLEVSDHFCRMTGYARDELIATKTTMDLTHEDDRAGDHSLRSDYLAGKVENYSSEKRFRRKDGSIVWVRVSAQPIRDEGGHLVQSAGIIEDISERRRAEDALLSHEERMSLAFQATQDGIWDWNLQTDAVFYSTRWKSMLGYGVDEIEPHVSACKRLLHPDDLPAVLAKVGEVLLGKAEYEMEFRMRHKDGHYVPILSRGFPVRSTSEKPIDRIVGTHVDLTQLRAKEMQLRESEERLRLALAAGRMAVWDWQVKTGQVLWNDEHYKMLGYAVGSVTPGYDAWKERVLDEDLARVEQLIRRSLETGGDYAAEFRVFGTDCKVRWLEASGRVEVDANASAHRLYGVMIDITERKHAEQQKNLLLAEVNHRAKNLLTVVQSIAQLTSLDTTPEDFSKNFANRLQGLSASQDLLIRSEWHGAPVDDLIQSQLPHFQPLIGKRILLQGPPVMLKPAAAQAIGMAIHELATNAAKYGALSTPDGMVRVTWTSHSGSDKGDFHMRWEEEGGPPVAAPRRQGFGQTVMVEMPEHLLEAEVSLTYPVTGVVWQLAGTLAKIAST